MKVKINSNPMAAALSSGLFKKRVIKDKKKESSRNACRKG